MALYGQIYWLSDSHTVRDLFSKYVFWGGGLFLIQCDNVVFAINKDYNQFSSLLENIKAFLRARDPIRYLWCRSVWHLSWVGKSQELFGRQFACWKNMLKEFASLTLSTREIAQPPTLASATVFERNYIFYCFQSTLDVRATIQTQTQIQNKIW